VTAAGTRGRGIAPSFRRAAGFLSAAGIAVVFALFVFGVAMRYLFDRPVSFVDEAVTLISVWSTFWTAAFVLKWPEHIAFDVVYANVAAPAQRVLLLAGATGFVILMGAAMPGMVDYTLFLWRERTDVMLLRLDWVYAVFPAFFAVMLLRFVLVLRRLVGTGWRAEVAHWSGADLDGEDGPDTTHNPSEGGA
jgi:TRAP-type C4-dicarboxylate transport system permease small subunit